MTLEDGRMYLDGVEITIDIRSDPVTAAVSQVSAHPAVRARLVAIQRHWVEAHGGRAVVEGRDIGSVVFPDAAVKVYLDARPEVRAQRRALQTGADPEVVMAEQERRDRLDSSRETSPLAVPDDAHIVDTSELSFPEVVNVVLDLVAAAQS